MIVKEGKDHSTEAQRSRLLWQNATGPSWTKWRSASAEDRNFAYGDQLTEKEIESLEAAGMPTFTVDKISSSIEMLKYFITASDPKFKAIGVEDSDSALAAVHTAVQRHSFYISNFRSVFGLTVEDSLCKSLGWLMVEVEPNLDRGMGEVVIKRLDPWDVYVDASSSDILFRDASYILIKKNFTKDYLVNALPEFKDQIKKATGNDEHTQTFESRDATISLSTQRHDIGEFLKPDGTTAEIIDYYERYEKVRVEYWSVTIRSEPTRTELEQINERVKMEMQGYAKEAQTKAESKAIELADAVKEELISKERHAFEMKQLQEQMQTALEQVRQELVNKYVSAISKDTMHVVTEKEYKELKKAKATKDSIVAANPYWETRVRVVCSVGDQTLYDNELALTDYPMVPIPYHYTGTPYPMSAVRKVVGKQTEVNKAHQIMIHNASLGSSLRWIHAMGAIYDEKEWDSNSSLPGGRLVYNQGFDEPKPILPMVLATAFIQITEKGEKDIEEMLGASPFSMGMESPKDVPYKGLVRWDEISTRRIRSWITNVVEPAVEHLGRVFTQLAQATYTAPKILRLVDPDTGQLEKYEINQPVYNDLGDVVTRFHDYPSTTFDMRIVSGSTLPKNKQAELAEMLELLNAGVVDDVAVLMKTDLPNKEQIMARKSLYAQQQQQIEALEADVKDKSGAVETLKRQLIQAGMKGKVNEADTNMRKTISDHDAELKVQVGKMIAEFKVQIGNALAEAKADAKIKKSPEAKT